MMNDKEAIGFAAFVLSHPNNNEELLGLMYEYLDAMAEKAIKGDKEIGNALIRYGFMMVTYLNKIPKCKEYLSAIGAQMCEAMPVPLYENKNARSHS